MSIAANRHPFTLDTEIRQRCTVACGSVPDTFIFVNTREQRLTFVERNSVRAVYTVSSSEFGTGNGEGSFKTPTGIHRIAEKIGAAAPCGRIFKDRLDTGVTWDQSMAKSDNYILSRILRLEGLEPGINKGAQIDSFERYIYIHGTDKEHRIGTPFSHGCIVMRNKEIIELFNMVPEQTLVIIV